MRRLGRQIVGIKLKLYDAIRVHVRYIDALAIRSALGHE